jgi:hypothetical protein
MGPCARRKKQRISAAKDTIACINRCKCQCDESSIGYFGAEKKRTTTGKVKPAGMKPVTMTRGGVKANSQAKATKTTATVKRSAKTKTPHNSTQIGTIPTDKADKAKHLPKVMRHRMCETKRGK